MIYYSLYFRWYFIILIQEIIATSVPKVTTISPNAHVIYII